MKWSEETQNPNPRTCVWNVPEAQVRQGLLAPWYKQGPGVDAAGAASGLSSDLDSPWQAYSCLTSLSIPVKWGPHPSPAWVPSRRESGVD